MNLKKTTLITVSVVASAIAIAGCSSPPEKINAAYVSPMQFQNYDCDQIRTELLRVNQRVVEVSGAQQSKANSDAVATGVGLVLFWPALFFLATDDHKAELSRLKGEYEALEKSANSKKCSVSAEIAEAKRVREEYQKTRKQPIKHDEKSGLEH